MSPVPVAPPAVTHNLWTIARIQDALTSRVLVRRFLLDLTHAPEHEVMNVFIAWRRIAATIENRDPQPPTPETVFPAQPVARERT
jgi:hypothetical protein